MRRALIAAALALGACDQPRDFEFEVRQVTTLTPVNLPAFFDCLRERGATVVSAHRGGLWHDHAENAIATFELTVSESPAFLEVDVSRTRDGALVLMHDNTVDRTTNGHGAVRDLTLAEFQALRLRDADGDVLDAHPPTLRQALDWAAGKTVLELDVKRGVSYEDVARDVRDAGAMERVIFITYSVDGASQLARIAPEAMTYTTIERASDIDTLERNGVDLNNIVAWLGDDELDNALVRALTRRNVEVRYGMFGGLREYEAVVGRGVQIVTVDDPPNAAATFDVLDRDDGYAALQCVGAR